MLPWLLLMSVSSVGLFDPAVSLCPAVAIARVDTAVIVLIKLLIILVLALAAPLVAV